MTPNLPSTHFASVSVSCLVHGLLLLVSPLWIHSASPVSTIPNRSILLELNKQPLAKISENSFAGETLVAKITVARPFLKAVVQIKRKNPQEKFIQQEQQVIDQKIGAIRKELQKSIRQTSLKQTDFQVLLSGKSSSVWNEYLDQIRGKVLKHWSPHLIRSDQHLIQSEARLDFIVTSRGEVVEYSIVDWKGSEQFRDFCLQAFQQSLPFGHFPKEIRRGRSGGRFVLSLFFYYQ